MIGAMDRGGAETMIMNIYRAIDRDLFQFDFLVHEQRQCDYDDEILELGGKIFRLPRFKGSNYFRYRSLCRQFFMEHGEHPIVHGHIGSCAAIYLSEAKRAGRVAVAHSHSQNFTPGLPGLLFRIASRPTRTIADWFIGCSYEAGLDRYGEDVVKGDRFSVLKNGIDLKKYRCDEQLHQRAKDSLGLSGRPVFGHVGRLAPEKNHALLFRAFCEVKTQLPDAVLVLAGRGPLEDSLKELARTLSIDDSVLFLGVRDDVPEILRAFDVFAFPSVKEGLPVAAIEAQASGLPVLLSTGVPVGAVASPRTQRISIEEGPEVWAARMVDACKRACLVERTDCIAEVRQAGFDIDDSANTLLALYKRLLDERSDR